MPRNDLISKGLEELEALRTELEQTVKTASEEAKEGWKKLRPRLEEAEKVASEKASVLAADLEQTAGAMIVEVRGQLEKLRDRIRKEGQGRAG
jgi:F0F1-type ATP synthase membrane subunit b/b'